MAAVPLAVALAAQAQFTSTNINGSLTITSYTGSNVVVTIPGSTNGYHVTGIGMSSFAYHGIVSVSVPDSVTFIGDYAFAGCLDLTNITMGHGVASIGNYAFDNCFSLPIVLLPNSLTNLGDEAFAECASLTGAFFAGNAPGPNSTTFFDDDAMVYYLPGTTGWGDTYGGATTAFWTLPSPLILNAGLNRGILAGGFHFTVSWATNLPIVVDACTNLAYPMWQPLRTNGLVNGTNYFSDPNWTNYPARFYRALQM
ncbi:MAG: leucine-rich repeat domain-containing protein [Verrucomicrobiota bacterium]